MLNSSKLKEWGNSALDFLNEQVWFQELKGKWEELDQQSRLYLKLAAIGCSLLIGFLFILSSIWSVHSLKTELAEKRELLNLIQSANDEMHRLKEGVPGSAGDTHSADNESGWTAYFESTASTAGIDKSNLTISQEKPGTANDVTKEFLFELTVKHVNIKQVVRYAFFLENNARPVKLRNLSIDTKGDPTGYLDAVFAISVFNKVGTNG